jgi:hypothetical protein
MKEHVLMKRSILVATLLLAGAVSQAHGQPAQPAQSTQPPEQLTPPAPVLERARGFARALGKPVSVKPTQVRLRSAEYTGHPLWTVGWSLDEGSVGVTVDQVTGRVVSYMDRTGAAALEAAVRDGRPLPVTEKQAEAAVRAALRHASAAPGDWRIGLVQLGQYGDGKSWSVGIGRYVDGKPCSLDRVFAQVNPLDNSIQYFSLRDSGIRIPQSGRLISKAQAQQIAAAAWRRFGGPPEVSPSTRPDGLPVWTQLSAATPLCRLAYNFSFSVKYDEKTVIYGATIDAETGELWWLRIMTGGGGGGFTPRPVPTSTRIALAAELLKDEEWASLGRAVASGAPEKAVKPAANGRKFEYQTGNQTVQFVLAPDGRELAWKQEAEDWAGVRLAAAESARLEDWLKSTLGGNPTAGRGTSR